MKATYSFDQIAHFRLLLEQKAVSPEMLQDFYDSGILADLLEVRESKKLDRDAVRRVLGHEPLNPPLLKSAISNYPAKGEVFEPTLDGDAPENVPIHAMVAGEGYNSKGWQFNGTRVAGKQTRRFKLVSVGYCRNLDEVRQKLARYDGKVAEGQWRQSFKAAYPKPDGKGPIGFADPSWFSPDGYAYFPYVGTGGGSGFGWADDGFGGRWRWLVGGSK